MEWLCMTKREYHSVIKNPIQMTEVNQSILM